MIVRFRYRLPLQLAILLAISPPVVFAQSLSPSFMNPTQADTLESGSGQAAPPFCCQRPYFANTMGWVLLLEVLPWYFNRHVSDDTTAALSFDSFKHNIREGLEWDPNSLTTNMFAHPFHGNVYFNSARSNGYDFWQSSAFAWLGSFLWEFFGENNRGAINDWMATSYGGTVIGEAFHRTAIMVRDNTATGTKRTLKEFGGFFIDPIGAGNRLFRGEMTRVGPNPEDRFPGYGNTLLMIGSRTVGDGNLSDSNTGGFFSVDVQYGNPFEEYERPFDSFSLSLQLNGRENTSFGRLQIEGALYGTELGRSENAHHVFHVTQHHDYVNNTTFETGGQGLSATFLSRYRLSDRWNLVTKIQPGALLLFAVKSEYADFTKRSYDFGSGAAMRLAASLNRDGKSLLNAFYIGLWSHTLNGASGDHFEHFSGIQGTFPITDRFGLGASYILSIRDSRYRDFPNVLRRNPQLRAFLAVF